VNNEQVEEETERDEIDDGTGDNFVGRAGVVGESTTEE